jgi:hypothetical protein
MIEWSQTDTLLRKTERFVRLIHTGVSFGAFAAVVVRCQNSPASY